jgi:hypothetical protein
VIQNEQEVFLAMIALKSEQGSFAAALVGALGKWAGCGSTLTLIRRRGGSTDCARLRSTVRAFARMPTHAIRLHEWGTQSMGSNLCLGHPPGAPMSAGQWLDSEFGGVFIEDLLVLLQTEVVGLAFVGG